MGQVCGNGWLCWWVTLCLAEAMNVSLNFTFLAQELGFPIRRPRTLCVCVNQETCVYVGPPPEELQAAFFSLFGAAVSLEGDDFVGLDTPEEQDANLLVLAKVRGVYADLGTLKTMPHTKLLPPLHAEHWKLYDEMYRAARQGAQGSFLVDTSQNPVARPRCGAWFPTIARSSTIRSISRNHTFTKRELDFAMGFPSLQFEGCQEYKSALAFDPATLSRRAFSLLQGNGIHCAAGLCFWSFVLSHVLRRSDVEQWTPPLNTPRDSKENDEQDS